MTRTKLFGWLMVGLLAVGAIGCNTVPRKDFDALQTQYNTLDAQNSDLNVQLATAKGRESELLAGVAAARTRAATAEANLGGARMEVDSLRAQVAKLSGRTGPPVPRPPIGTGTTITLAGDVLFSSGKASLTTAGKRSVAGAARTILARRGGVRIVVVGHTDSDPIRRSKWRDNEQLSLARATAVASELIAQGVPAGNIQTQGMGARSPVASNTTALGKAKNRRVVIQVVG